MKSVFVIGFTLFALNSCASDWPLYRGPNGDGILTETGIATEWPQSGLKQIWSIPLHDDGKNTHAGASVAGGRVYVPSRIGSKDVIYCLDAATGKEIWNYSYESSGKAQTYGTGIRAAPTVSGGFVYTLGCYGQLYCLDAAKGTLVWNLDLLKDFPGRTPKFGMAAAPVVMNGKLICEPGANGASVVALDPATGKTLWQSGDGPASYAVPQKLVVGGVEQVLTYLESGLVSFELETGKELWRFDYLEEREKNIPQPIISGNTIYFSNNTLGFSAIQVSLADNQWKATRLWTVRKEKLHYSSPVLGDGCLYYQNSKRELHCMDVKDGNVLWSARNIGLDFATLIRLDEHNLLAALDDGNIVLLDVSPAAWREKARFQAVDKCFMQAAISDARLFVRDHEKLVCYNLRPEAPDEISAAKATPPATGKSKHSGDGSFLSSWKIKRNEYIVTWLAAVALSILGVIALSRGQLLAAGVTAEAATFGMGVAMLIDGVSPKNPEFFHSSKMYMWTPILISLFAASVIGIGRKGRFQAATLWSTAAVMAIGSVVLTRLSVSTIDMNVVLWSTEIGGTRTEVTNFTVAAILTVAAALAGRAKFSSSTTEFGTTGKVLIPIWFAIVTGFAVRSTGTFFTVACLLLPALFARAMASTFLARIASAVLLALVATTAGWVIAPHYLCSFALPAACIMALMAGAAGVRSLAGRKDTTVSEAPSL